MAILILGGAGYIGAHTAAALIKAGEETVIADNLQTGHIGSVHEKSKFYKGDIRNKSFLDKIFKNENIESVIHFAADSVVPESMKKPLKYYENNLLGTMVLLQSMVEHGTDKIVFSSTAAVFGEPEKIPIDETDKTDPSNPYGETKLAMEKLFKWTSLAHNIRYVSLRYFNACGASPCGTIGEDHSPETHLIPLVLEVPNGKRDAISVFGDDYDTADGTCVRDYVHVCDLAQAHILAVDYLHKGGKNDVFNLGNGKGFSVKEVIETARKVTGHSIPSILSKRRAGDPSTLVAESTKAKNVLGWKPEFSAIDEIISTAWKWHKNYPCGYGEKTVKTV